MSHKLNVWLFTKQVGTLGLVNGRLNFEYTQFYLARCRYKKSPLMITSPAHSLPDCCPREKCAN